VVRRLHGSNTMGDWTFILLTVAFFLGSWIYADRIERL
jgi:hypothetical protein